MSASTVSKIMKGIGETKIGQKAKKVGKFIDTNILEDIPEKDKYNAMMYQVFPKRIKPKYVWGTAGVIGTGALVKSAWSAESRNDLGEVSGGSLSHMSSSLSPLTYDLQEGQYDNANIMHKTNAQGDIVFALHNMR